MCDTNKGILLRLTLAQGDLILEGLVERPFRQVYHLIGQLHRQAAGADPQDLRVMLTHAQLRLVLEVLGAMPFNRVQRLLQVLHGQVQAWLQASPAPEASLSED